MKSYCAIWRANKIFPFWKFKEYFIECLLKYFVVWKIEWNYCKSENMNRNFLRYQVIHRFNIPVICWKIFIGESFMEYFTIYLTTGIDRNKSHQEYFRELLMRFLSFTRYFWLRWLLYFSVAIFKVQIRALCVIFLTANIDTFTIKNNSKKILNIIYLDSIVLYHRSRLINSSIIYDCS